MLALSFASLGYAAPHDDTPALVLFTAEQMQRTGAACLDGSAPGYYLNTRAGGNDFMFFLQGGGACEAESDCKARASDKSANSLGSSVGWTEGPRGRWAAGRATSEPTTTICPWSRPRAGVGGR